MTTTERLAAALHAAFVQVMCAGTTATPKAWERLSAQEQAAWLAVAKCKRTKPEIVKKVLPTPAPQEIKQSTELAALQARLQPWELKKGMVFEKLLTASEQAGRARVVYEVEKCVPNFSFGVQSTTWHEGAPGHKMGGTQNTGNVRVFNVQLVNSTLWKLISI